MQLPTEFVYPALLYLIIPVALFLLWLTRHSFVRDNPRFDDAASIKRRSKLRWTVFILRTIAIVCLLIAIATPLTQQTKTRAGDSHITVLIDNSSSMAFMDTDFVPELIADLRSQVPVSVYTITPGETSAIGDGVLSYLKPDENVLLITDGNNNAGPSLSTVAAYAQQTNSTISAIRLKPREDDAAVYIMGPAKAIADTNVTLGVAIPKTHTDDVKLTVTIDDAVVFDDETDESVVTLVKSFPAGKHRISASIASDDALVQNNQYDFLLNVVDKPKILLVTQKPSGFQPLLSQLYSVTTQATLPKNKEALDEYYAVVLVDVPASAVSGSTNVLTDYLLAGNGLLVVGGPHSFDYGGYKNTVFESLLPVTVGKGKDRDGVTNIAVVMDLSGSVSGSYVRSESGQLVYQKSDRPALTRALALSVLDGLDVNHNVGAVVVGSASANSSQNIRGQDQLIQWDYVGGQQVGKVSLLGPKKETLSAAVASVQGGGQAASQYWIAAPMRALESTAGAKNIIIITDGQSCTQNCQASNGGSDEESTIGMARTVAAQGGKVYVVGVVPGQNDDFLMGLAAAGNGIYFPASQQNKLRILFGDPTQTGDAAAFGLVVLNENHFITHDVPLAATMYGYNEVVPRPYSSLLVTAGKGQPALTVWNYGVGRVATLTTYNGDDYGELLFKGNSLLLSRTGNWVVGDPERKEEYIVTVPQFHVGTAGTITVQSDRIPVTDDLRFTAVGSDTFEATYVPQTTGFGSVGGIAYAASYPVEYQEMGMNPSLGQSLAASGGKVFDPDATDDIIEHVQTVRQLQELQFQPLRYPFILAAALLFLIEIALRRLYEVLRSRSV
jgi:uncharacterized membrane protein